MADPTPTPTPAPTPKTKRQRSTVNRAHLDELANSRKVAKAAADPANAAALAVVEFDAKLPVQITALADQTEKDIGNLSGSRVAKKEMTAQEKTARDALIAVIAPVQTAAKRKFTGDQAAFRQAYFVGEPLASDTLKEVQIAANAIYNRLAPGANNAPPQDVLPGIKDVQIQALANAIKLYGDKNAAQGDEQNQATGQLEAIVANIEKLAVLRHQVQLAAEQAFPWRNPGVPAIRQSFLLPVDRPLPG